MVRTLIALRPVADGAKVTVEGQPFTPATEQDEKSLVASGRWRVATKDDLAAWKTHLSSDPALQAVLGAAEPGDGGAADDPAAVEAKRIADQEAADAETKRIADQAAAEAEAKRIADAEAANKKEQDPKNKGGKPGPGGIG